MTTAQSQSHALFRLADVTTRKQLVRALGVPSHIFQEVITCEDPGLIYDLHRIPKRNPRNAEDYRIAWESRDEPVARSHKAVARRLDDFARRIGIGYPHPAVHGFVRGGSTRSNALPHCGARVVVRADIENFFQSITLERIVEMLRSIGMNAKPAQQLACFATIHATLPLGLPESPVISNLVCLDLDNDLQVLADRTGVRYTRYADDITFSGYENLPSKDQISATLNRHGFRLSARKFRKSKRGQSHFVTGLSVSEKDCPHVPRKLKRRLRLELHFCERFGLEKHSLKIDEEPRKTLLRLGGMVQYVSFIECRKAASLRNKWSHILENYLGPTQYKKIANRNSRDRTVIVDETEFGVGVHRYLAICLVRIYDLQKVEGDIDGLLGDYLTEPGAKGNLSGLKRTGVHYTDAHPDLRTHTLSLMTDTLPWSAAIHFAQIDSPRLYREVYLRLFTNAIKQEFITSSEAALEVFVERNDKIKRTRLVTAVKEEYERSVAEDGRRPKSLPDVDVVEKSSTRSLTLPDFALAAFRNYAQPVDDERVLEFERIRDRVRYVYDEDNDVYYTRKRPFVSIGGR